MTRAHAAAPRCVEPVRALALHLFAFVAVNAVLFTQSGFRPEAGHFWGWGVGVAAHALAVLGPSRIEQRLLGRHLDRQGPDGRS